MPGNLQQQTPQDLNFSKSDAKPQHGKKADTEAMKREERRTFEPRPGRS